MARIAWQSHLSVVARASRIVAPAIAWHGRPPWPRPRLARDSIRAEESAQQAKVANRRCLVALPFVAPDSSPPERAAKHIRAGMNSAERVFARLSLARNPCRNQST